MYDVRYATVEFDARKKRHRERESYSVPLSRDRRREANRGSDILYLMTSLMDVIYDFINIYINASKDIIKALFKTNFHVFADSTLQLISFPLPYCHFSL